jgi:histidinol-phosphate aminotransferase
MLNTIIQRNIRSDALPAAVVTHATGAPPIRIKLDAMENPFDLPLDIKKSLGKHLSLVALNRYPTADLYQKTCHTICQHAQIDLNNNNLDILLGNGSDEIISMLSNILPHNAMVWSAAPSFIMYKISAMISRIQFDTFDLNAHDFSLNISTLEQKIQQQGAPHLLYLAYPNNPTGACFNKNDVYHIIKTLPNTFIIIDEAYHAFSGNQSFLTELADIIQTYPNVMLMRTLSKTGLAGLRLGYIFAHQRIIAMLDQFRPPYNINVLTQHAAQFLLQDKYAHMFKEQAKYICAQRSYLQQELAKFGHVFESHANFLLLKLGAHMQSSADVYQYLQNQGILIKHVHAIHETLNNCVRISVGTKEENESLLHAMNHTLL